MFHIPLHQITTGRTIQSDKKVQSTQVEVHKALFVHMRGAALQKEWQASTVGNIVV